MLLRGEMFHALPWAGMEQVFFQTQAGRYSLRSYIDARRR
jgi:hypothetical protein